MVEHLRLDDHPLRDDLNDLRAESLRWISVALLACGVGLLFVGAVNLDIGTPKIWIAVLLFFSTAGGTWRLVDRTYGRAVILLIVGMMASISAVNVLYAEPRVLFALPFVVFVTPLLLNYAYTLLTAAAAGALVVLLNDFSDGITGGDAVAVILLLIGSSVLACIVFRPLRTMLDWAWQSYLEERRKTDEIRVHQIELARLSKSLSEACERLEQANVALTEARCAAEEACRLKGEFATMISHELRTPLNLVIGFCEALVNQIVTSDDHEVPEGLEHDLETIYRNAYHMSDLIDDVLDLGRLEAHRLALQKQWRELTQIVQEAVTAVAGLYAKVGLVLEVEISSDVPPLYVDATRIRQVLINLLTNAVRHTDEGSVRVMARRDGGDVIVSVADTGVGIPSEDLPYVFDRFRQTGPRHRRGGFGLGLTISKQFVEMHAGSMWVTSEVNHGTVFSFSLPVMENVTPCAANPKFSIVDRFHPENARDRTVLVLDHGEEAARLFRRYLDHCRVLAAATPADAERLAKSESLNAIILPRRDLTGQEVLLDTVLSHQPSVPIYRCEVRTADRARDELGVAGFLTKPVSHERLRETLATLKREPRRVLVVDDDLEMLALLTRMLQTIVPGCGVQTATNGEQGLAVAQSIARKRELDLVLLDLLMPGLDGQGFLKVWQSDRLARKIPIVVISGAWGDEHDLIVADAVEVQRARGLSIGDLMRVISSSLDLFVPDLAC